MSAAFRVLAVDDQQLLRRGLIMLFGTVGGIDVVAQVAHEDEVLAVLRAKRIDVALVDAKTPVMDGIELVRWCARSHPGLPVLILTTFDKLDIVRGVIAAGAAGFLLRDTSVESLAEAVRAVADDGLVIDPRAARLTFTTDGSQMAGDKSPVLAALTPTERRVASLVAEGLTSQAIAARMVLAESTVKNHVSTLLHKLQAPDHTALTLTLYKAFQSWNRSRQDGSDSSATGLVPSTL